MTKTTSQAESAQERQILSCWQQNAAPWVRAIAERQIESRRLVTDQAIIETLLTLPGKRCLDIGCGEGWLVRELTHRGKTATGIDATPELINNAKSQGSGEFYRLNYSELNTNSDLKLYDIAVCNFSLLGKASVDRLFDSVAARLYDNGNFVVQTLHPLSACGEQAYQDGWREGSWAGFDSAFVNAAPWYFRTLESWIALFYGSGFSLTSLQEPLHPETQKPASLILIGQKLQQTSDCSSHPPKGLLSNQ